MLIIEYNKYEQRIQYSTRVCLSVCLSVCIFVSLQLVNGCDDCLQILRPLAMVSSAEIFVVRGAQTVIFCLYDSYRLSGCKLAVE